MVSNVLFIFLICTTFVGFTQCSKSFTINLMHRDSPNSPYHNASMSKWARVQAAARRSTSRADYFNKITNRATTMVSPDIDSKVFPAGFEYLMAINIGTPKFQVLAIADTGSDLIWAQCKPCIVCYNQTDPIFDTNSSTTYGTVPCASKTCESFPESSCGGSLCGYEYSYGDGSTTIGVLSTETFSFESTSNGTVQVPNVLFGCSHETKGTFDKADGGLVGLGGGPLSLVSQLGPLIDYKFSYCLVPYDMNTTSSLLNFGENAVVGPNSLTTPLFNFNGEESTFYFLALDNITVGNMTNPVNLNSTLSSKPNIIIDSGTTLTILNEAMVKPLVATLSSIINLPRANYSDDTFDTCFEVSNATNYDIELPNMTFQFSGAPLTLPPMNTFVLAEDNVLCLAIVSSGEGGIQIFGNLAQQNLLIEYDLTSKKMSFEPTDCTKQ